MLCNKGGALVKLNHALSTPLPQPNIKKVGAINKAKPYPEKY